LPPGEVLDQDGSCDLVMVAAAVWEPATDADRFLGEGGPAAVEDPFIVQGLKSLRGARNWREVRARTQELHRLVHYHLPILPLWQIIDRFAVRNSIQGVTPRPVTLYQDIQRWRLK
jgi:ABC-type oligopeptide transport system substrate-binding subunit